MARLLSDIRASVRDTLRDEFVEGVTLSWESDELDRLIRMTLDEIEQKMPREERVKAYGALSTVSPELSASGTTLGLASDDDFSTSYPFYITIEDECLKVTELTSIDNFTVSRAQKGTTAAIHAKGKDIGLTILTSSNSKEIDLTNISDFIRVRKHKGIEYQTGQNPKRFRNWTQFAKVLTMDMNLLPSADETVWLYCLLKHTLTDKISTLESDHEIVLIQGVAARAAMNKGREQFNALNVGGVNVGPRMVDWGKDQLILYRQALRRHALQDPWEALPKD